MHKLILIAVLAFWCVGCDQATNSSNQASQSAASTPLATSAETPAVTADESTSATAAGSLIITPLVGVGELKFGMSKDQAIEVLGEPERMQVPMCLEYISKGMMVMTPGDSPDEYAVSGLLFSVSSAPDGSPGKCEYKTADGIGMGSTLEDLQKAFGKPSAVQNVGPRLQVDYMAIGASFTLSKNRVVHMAFYARRK